MKKTIKNKNIQDTKKIIKFNDVYREKKESANVEITRTYYGEDAINKTLGKINNEIAIYRSIYKTKPIMILISKELEILFQMQLEIMNQRQMIMLNDEAIRINRVFGLSCISTPVLTDLDFKVI